ncbi:hypothetical protein [Nitrosomonas sp. Nm166]|uniref:hypothetical protein n=1 Tax=Nitrosomonas sp. Nm166 TaxID=1881054 RepID=UPI0008E46ABD|nr:hypothetical protein [Nitrosomonas sp. Nm166]SFD86260.1 hypothetical protein SAMN05428977_100195 [Nitrosomonas sp. Nm166]
MNITIKGPGEIVVRFIDQNGKALLQETIRVSGSGMVEAKRDINLSLETLSGQVLVSPVLIQQGEKQQVTFDGEHHSSFTRKRCQEIGCTQNITEDAAHGHAQPLQEGAIHLPSAQK